MAQPLIIKQMSLHILRQISISPDILSNKIPPKGPSFLYTVPIDSLRRVCECDIAGSRVAPSDGTEYCYPSSHDRIQSRMVPHSVDTDIMNTCMNLMRVHSGSVCELVGDVSVDQFIDDLELYSTSGGIEGRGEG